MTQGGEGALLAPMFVFMFLFMVGFWIIYLTEIYRFIPGWGPVRKFDARGDDDMRISQAIIHQRVQQHSPHVMGPEAAEEARKVRVNYGAIGEPTWGTIEAPWTRREEFWHPQLGEVAVKHGFTDSQHMRAHSTWWARDEPKYIREAGLKEPVLAINDVGGDLIEQRMA
mmetsp:Transcript_14601/g.42186  ORF Transcript_14601/g.42186 Transcript_14601/m.42186 type:complete len:169 (-) Transcript_14601:97-603(-)